jgi:hypothetical protein
MSEGTAEMIRDIVFEYVWENYNLNYHILKLERKYLAQSNNQGYVFANKSRD